MPNTTTTGEATRSPIDGTELVRLATPGANWKATLSAIFAAISRTVLEANASYYVSTTGSDVTGDGSSGNPWATLAHANDYLRNKLDFGGFRVDLIIQTAGSYTGFSDGGGYIGGGILSIHGATNAPNSYVVSEEVVNDGVFRFIYDTTTQIRFDQLTFKPTSNFTDCIWNDCRAAVYVAGNWGDGLGQAVTMDFSSDVTNANGWILSGAGKMGIFGTIGVTVPPTKKINTFYGSFGFDDNNIGGSLQTTFATFNFSNDLRTTQFVFADSFSSHINGGDTFNFLAGSAVSGAKYFAETCGLINTFNKGELFFPGPTLGALSSGGQYL